MGRIELPPSRTRNVRLSTRLHPANSFLYIYIHSRCDKIAEQKFLISLICSTLASRMTPLTTSISAFPICFGRSGSGVRSSDGHSLTFSSTAFPLILETGRDGETRTHDSLLPKQAASPLANVPKLTKVFLVKRAALKTAALSVELPGATPAFLKTNLPHNSYTARTPTPNENGNETLAYTSSENDLEIYGGFQQLLTIQFAIQQLFHEPIE